VCDDEHLLELLGDAEQRNAQFDITTGFERNGCVQHVPPEPAHEQARGTRKKVDEYKPPVAAGAHPSSDAGRVDLDVLDGLACGVRGDSADDRRRIALGQCGCGKPGGNDSYEEPETSAHGA
jgi:hypothetical protein